MIWIVIGISLPLVIYLLAWLVAAGWYRGKFWTLVQWLKGRKKDED